jgi:FkbM family methyltransferase
MNKTISRAIEVYHKKGFLVLLQASLDNIHFKLSKTFSKTKYPIVTVHNSKMILSFDDTGLSKQLYLHRTREPKTTEVMKNIVEPYMTILEVGANIGYYALMEANLMNDMGVIYALEPFWDSFDLLNKNIELNGYKSILTYQLACSNKKGKEKLFLSPHFNTCNMTNDKGLGYDMVDVVSVDGFLRDKKKPDIVRMDVEGYEYYIIEGMKDTLKHIKYLVVEWHSSAKKEGWESRIDSILDAGLKPIHIVRKVRYRDEEYVDFNEHELKDIIKNHRWIGIVFKRR